MVTVVVLVALFACFAGAAAVARSVRLTDYASFRAKGSFFQVFMTLLGTLVGGFMFFGLSAIGYEAGLAGVAVGIGYALGLLLLAMLAGRLKKICENDHIDTIDDLIYWKFGPVAQGFSSVINMVVFLAILGAQFIAIKAFLQVFTTISSDLVLYTAVVVVIGYTTLSGFRGVLLTDLWQVLVISISAVTIFSVAASHTPQSALETLEASHFCGTGYGVGFLVGAALLFPFSLLCRSDLWQRIACARDAMVARRAFLWAAPVLLVFYIMLTMLGVFGAASLGTDVRPELSGLQNFLRILNDMGISSAVSTVLLAILALGVFAALLSTADSYLNIVAISLSKVFRRSLWKRFEDEGEQAERTAVEKQLLSTTRSICLALGVAAFGVAIAIPNIVDLIVGAISVLFVLLPSVVAALRDPWKRGSQFASVTSMVLGLATYIVLSTMMPNNKAAFVPATAMAAFAYWIVSLLTRRIESQETPARCDTRQEINDFIPED